MPLALGIGWFVLLSCPLWARVLVGYRERREWERMFWTPGEPVQALVNEEIPGDSLEWFVREHYRNCDVSSERSM